MVHDRMRGGNPVLLMMWAVLASVLVFAAGGVSAPVFLGAAFLLGFCYGGSLALFPSEVAAVYGVNVLGSVYPVVLALHGLAAVAAAPLTGLGVDITGGYWPGMLMACGMAVIGIAVCSLLPERGR
jgi:OFA family oxalate/formate antiporter-like MFS transporter